MPGYQLKDAREFEATVTVRVPKAGGQADEFRFDATFVALDAETRRDFGPDRADVLGSILRGWKGLEDESGAPLPFNDESLAAVARDPFLSTAIIMAYGAALSPEAQRKN